MFVQCAGFPDSGGLVQEYCAGPHFALFLACGRALPSFPAWRLTAPTEGITGTQGDGVHEDDGADLKMT